jgi:Zn-dependent peptidase ImmA (M78 family)
MAERWEVNYLSKGDIKKRATQFLVENYPQKDFPVPVDLIAEEKLGIDIVPTVNLQQDFDIEAFLGNDCRTIYIDSTIYNGVETRYRFSVAHELGHYYLHRQFYRDIHFDSIEEWIKVYDEMDDDFHSRIEFQAYTFAGFILIPDPHLGGLFTEQLAGLSKHIEIAKQQGIDRNCYMEYVIDKVAIKLAPLFNVSHSCMVKRINGDPTCSNKIP